MEQRFVNQIWKPPGSKIHTGEIPITQRFHVGNKVKVKEEVLSHFSGHTGQVIRIGRASDNDIEVLFNFKDRLGKETCVYNKNELELI